ncbi:MAG: hypothetical protein BGP16_04700 [Sphingobium sp. 66-54]|jgi:hypothetical protein|nr:MAG: hypothetical protein BGP16_04700 [Sphingobium sp. 66-54]
MTRHFTPPSHDASIMPAMLIEAARCWRDAQDSREPVQPSLFAMLSRYGHGMSAPVFDSIMTLVEGVSGRRIATGTGPSLSEDEHRLIGMLDEASPSSGDSGLVAALDCAVKSLRILLTRPIGITTARLAA